MVISESTHPHIASVLRNGFNCALVKQFAIQQGVETSVDVGSQSSKSKLSAVKETAGGVLSVLSLPPSLVEMVRSIQLKQADLKARLHLKADSFT